ncbi:hypothetical protein ACFVWG_20625 [Kribbella sp. NPDC058245]|uniref:hypothetical protein n=1 Tax=Kribbella sp. NPDC058245 TaxID=3346399 RepID=UPI0036F09C64
MTAAILAVGVLAGCTTAKDEANPPAVTPSVSPSMVLDTVEGASGSAAADIVGFLITRPPSDYNRGLADIGHMDFITTRQDQDGVGDALSGPHLTINRDLDILPNGEDPTGGNQVTVRATVPVANGRIASADIDFTFTQHSSLAGREFSPESLRAALRTEMGAEVAFDSVAVTLSGAPVIAGTGYYIMLDERTGKLVMIDDKTMEQVAATVAQERQIVTTLQKFMSMLKSAETAHR